MCVIGNPPYSGISSNNGKWISDLIEDYKYIDGEHFKERKHWLNDDYVKFLRFGQHFIEKNGHGIIAFINPHGFLDNPTFRGMRWNLLKTYDKIYTIDLHGNSKKKETALDGSPDVNVFDIQQGVSINIFIKTGLKKEKDLGKVFHYDLLGKRNFKYDFLTKNSISTIAFNELTPKKPHLLFVEADLELMEEYNSFFSVNDLFEKNSVGCVSANDRLNISYSKNEQIDKINDILEMNESEWRTKYKRPKDARDWTYLTAKSDALKNKDTDSYIKINYRPFDLRWSLYTGNSRGLYSSPQPKVMNHLVKGENLGLVIGRQGQVVGSMPWNLIFISDTITDFNMYYRGGGMLFPLYVYTDGNQQLIGGQNNRTPNFNNDIISEFANGLKLNFTNEIEENNDSFAPIDVLDYIYSVLHSHSYRKKYHSFLKIDFPKIPYPTNIKSFKSLVKQGKSLREIHLLKNNIVEKYITQYPEDGDNIVEKPFYKDGSVFISKSQYFTNVPEIIWNFHVGGYQPAQKWLKDRKGRELGFEDILHYQKIIVALSETDRIMKDIDKIEI